MPSNQTTAASANLFSSAKRLRRLGLGACLLTALPAAAWAEQAATILFEIPPQPLSSALNRFAEISDLQLSYPAELASGIESPGVSGRHSPEEALELILQGSGLHYRIMPGKTVTVERGHRSQLTLDKLLAMAPADEYAGIQAEAETNPVIEQEDMTVSGRPHSGYGVINASTATKTDTPILETPVSIQVVPREVFDDQQAIRLDDITKNVSGVQPMRQLGVLFDNFVIRGFTTPEFNVYRDGLRLGEQSFETDNLERVEILKGPVSTLYGRSAPGGLVNMVTKKPMAQPRYSLSQQFGSYDLYRTTLDATGAITSDEQLAYRLNFVYMDAGSFRDFVDRERIFAAPQLTWKPTDQFEMNFGYEYKNDDITGDRGIPAIGNRPAGVPIGRFIGEPNFSLQEAESHLAHLTWSYKFNQEWKVQQKSVINILDTFNRNIVPISLQADNKTVNRGLFNGLTERETYATDINLNGKLDFFGTRHNVLVGFDFLRFEASRGVTFLARAPFITPVDMFDPVYNTVDIPEPLPKNNFVTSHQEWYGVYFQDQVDLTDSFHFLFSGRHDWARSSSGFSSTSAPKLSSLSTAKFSPRIGLVYQPTQWLSFFANWTEALGATNGHSSDGRPLEPETAEQFEGGIKLELFDGRLNASLAVYELTKENILTDDTSTPDEFDQIAIGRARSSGVEFDVSGQITDQWSLIGNYAYTDTKVLKDSGQFGSAPLQGNALPNVPRHSASLWTNYEVTEGLKFGTGVFIASQRQANVDNDFQLPGYVRWDAMAAYQWKLNGSKVTAQVNVNNILDKQYFLYADQFGNPRFDAMPGEPLTVLGSLRFEY